MIRRVLPGVEEVFARFLRPVTMLMSDGAPTLLLPMKAYSGRSGFGHCSKEGLLIRYSAFLISMILVVDTVKDRRNCQESAKSGA